MNIKFFLKKYLFPGLDVGLRARVNKISPKIKDGNFLTLDIGCGNAAFTLAAVKKGNIVWGIDGDSQKLNRCKDFFNYIGINKRKYKFLVHDIYKLRDLNKKFDQIFLFETLEHLEKDNLVLKILSSIAADNGIIHISTPRLNRKPYYDEYLTDTEDGGHMRLGYEINQLTAMCKKQGLEIKESFSFFGQVSILRLNIMNAARYHGGSLSYLTAFFLTLPLRVISFFFDPGPNLFIYLSAIKSPSNP
jgi:SAM-dependent methyltransferase